MPEGLAHDDALALLAVVEEMSRARDLEGVMRVVRRAARGLMRADGASFVLREGDQVYYADEDAIAPLWKGRRFPAAACVSGWAIRERASVAIEDIYADPRVPVDAYRPTFVKSLLMVPIRVTDPLGAIGAYWATPHHADAREVALLQALAGFAAVAVANAELNQRAEDAVAARERWLGIASHELRTPLTPVSLQLQGAMRALAAEKPPREILPRLAHAVSCVERMTRLVDRLLDYSRFSSNGVDVSLESFDLSAVAREVAEQFRPAAESVGAAIEVVGAGRVEGRWDRQLIEEVCSNLIANAVKHGGGKPITVEIAGLGDVARLAVRDQGGGISPEHHERIFQPFSQLDSNTSGVGLGLWIVREIVRAHAGTVSVMSAPGHGTAMIVDLPVDDSASSASAAPPEAARPVAGRPAPIGRPARRAAGG